MIIWYIILEYDIIWYIDYGIIYPYGIISYYIIIYQPSVIFGVFGAVDIHSFPA